MLKRTVIYTLIMISFSGILHSQTFKPIGMGGGGRMYTPAISPHDPGILFVTCDARGLYKSSDGGDSWNVRDSKQIDSCNLCYPAFDPVDKNKMYMGRSGAVMMSNDKGETWSTVRTLPNIVRRIYVDPENTSNVYQGTTYKVYKGAVECTDVNDSAQTLAFYISTQGGKSVFAATVKNVWRSDNDGVTWTKKMTGISAANLRGFCGGSSGSTTRLFAVGDDKKIYVSTNKGDSWTQSGTTGLGAYTFKDIVCAENFPNTAYVNADETMKIYKTTDGGANWSNVFKANTQAWQGVPDDSSYNVTLGWIAYDMQGGIYWGGPMTSGFCVSPDDPNYVLGVTYGEAFHTKDGGLTWNSVYTKYADSGPRGRNKKWSSVGLECTYAHNYYIHPGNHNIHYACFTDTGLSSSEDGGKTWAFSVKGSPFENTFFALAFDPDDPATIYAAASNDHDINEPDYPGGVVVSHDYGKTWTMSSTGLLTKDWGASGVYPYPCSYIAIDPSDKSLYVTCHGDGVYKSTNKAASWTKISTLPASIGANKYWRQVKIHSDGTIFVGMSGRFLGSAPVDPGGIWRSKDKGATWTSIAANVNGSGLYNPKLFDVHPSDSKIIYWGNCSTVTSADAGVYKTTNGGVNWTKLNIAGQTIEQFRSLTIDESEPSTVYESSSDFVPYVSLNNGVTWAEVPMKFKYVRSVFIDYLTKDLYMCTSGCGIWTNAGATSISGGGSGVADFKPIAYPNPCRIEKAVGKQIKIVSLPSDATVQIFNSTGELLKSINQSDFGNLGFVCWDGKNVNGDKVPQGTYFYIACTANVKKTGKISILR